MTTHDFTKALAALAPEQHKYAIKGIQRGIEREALRIKPNGVISQQGHPKGVGCALTNGHMAYQYAVFYRTPR